jgi:enoyl-CoA hydratase/carnithine racemase
MSDMHAGSQSLVSRESSNGIVTLCLNRPQQFNALSDGMLDALQTQLDVIAGEPSVRCVILSAAGKAFCAGHDLREMRGTPKFEYYEGLFAKCSRVMQSIQALPVPVIARVQGIATAAGCQLVASCDLAIASDHARFAVSGINVGLFCSTPAVALSRNISTKNAFDMLVTGKFIDAATAKNWGLINEAVDDTELDAAIAAKVAEISAKSQTAIRYGKAMFYRQREMALADAYAYAATMMARNMMEEDACEGVDAFIEKRLPRTRS